MGFGERTMISLFQIKLMSFHNKGPCQFPGVVKYISLSIAER
jgi:hypothetical protein